MFRGGEPPSRSFLLCCNEPQQHLGGPDAPGTLRELGLGLGEPPWGLRAAGRPRGPSGGDVTDGRQAWVTTRTARRGDRPGRLLRKRAQLGRPGPGVPALRREESGEGSPAGGGAPAA